jgi:putative copper export protein
MFEISEAVREFFSFVLQFFTVGAVGFRLFVLRRDREPEIFDRASRRAAALALAGAIGSMFLFIFGRMATAAGQHKALSQVLSANISATVQTICVFVLIIATGLAFSRVDGAWFVAAAAIFASPLAPLLVGEWPRIINPVHRVAGGMWIGTLFVMVFAGFTANMVYRFSPLALTAFAVLASTGVITAWRHLKRLDNLWATPYGTTLIIKLCVVAVVVALGAWNWRRHAASSLRRSAIAEVTAATIVLMITAVLVSLPSPK